MKKYFLIVFILFLFCTDANAYDLYAQNNNWFVPEQWGFRSGYTLKENYLMDMKPKWEQTKAEWTNTYNPKPIRSNWKNAVTDTKIYGDAFGVYRIPRKWLNKF
jgi:hypothetical protein